MGLSMINQPAIGYPHDDRFTMFFIFAVNRGHQNEAILLLWLSNGVKGYTNTLCLNEKVLLDSEDPANQLG